MYEDFIRFLVEVIADERKVSSAQVEPLVRNLVFSLKGLLAGAETLQRMEEMIALQVEVFLKVL